MLWFPTDPLPLNPLLKVPLVLSGTYLVHRGYLTPPHPPADKTATSAYGEKRDVMSRPNAWRWTDAVKVCNTHAACESDAYTSFRLL